MKRMHIAALLAALLLALCACGLPQGPEETPTLRLYGRGGVSGGDAIAAVELDWSACQELAPQEQARELLEQLLGGCELPDYRTPIPSGVRLLHCEVSGGTAWVDFSQGYDQLSGIDLTIADYCVALSLNQLSGVSAVRITVAGQELAYQDHGLLLADEVLMTSQEDVVRTLPVRLYFPGQDDGELTSESRVLTLYEGESAAAAIMEALLAGPEAEGLQPLLPEGFQVLTVRVEDGVCLLNLPRSNAALLGENEARLVQGVVRSLCSARGVGSVQILLDGEMSSSFGSVDISQPLLPQR